MSGIRPVVLVVIDGWGESLDPFGNAIEHAVTPEWDALRARWPWTTVAASGEAVGLPPGQQGNSEVGHLTIGAGRVIFQDLPRITRAIESGAFFANQVLVDAVERALGNGGTLHVLGLVSPGGVHSHVDHGLAVAELARRRGLNRVAFHVFCDGRDEPPTSGAGFVTQFEADLVRIGVGRIASICGRYWAMDRDQRWERTARAYTMLTGGPAEVVTDPVGYIRREYAAGVTDEFLPPVAVVESGGARSSITAGDTIIYFNFRADRTRQLSHALVDPIFSGFDRGDAVPDLRLITFTEYEHGLTPFIAFPKPEVPATLAETVSRHGLRQFHVAETEKYAHVTYFMNGGREEPFAGESRMLIPSQKVATYDLAPEMSATAVTDAVVGALEGGTADLIMVNYANPDMVGHTGVFDATVVAVEVVDRCLARLAAAVDAAGGVLLLTADHGNAEHKIDPHGAPLTAHTTSPVPVLLAGAGHAGLRAGGGLADVAPTVLAIMGLAVPDAMTGHDLRLEVAVQR